ncbi:hypothetical protein [Palleronia salina]|uniref:hypothetical protein n=1 Tax=Palleronia salina TaxID=313368 RepID=UPI001587A3D2|nr:hypothetical protein [Palleronia salina]
MNTSIKTTAIFLQDFNLRNFDETLPAGEYSIETGAQGVVGLSPSSACPAFVIVHLHPRPSHPGLSRTFTMPLADLEYAVAKDKATGKPLLDYFIEEMLADPMVCLVMQADGWTDCEVREIYSGQSRDRLRVNESRHPEPELRIIECPQVSGPRTGSNRPGIGE